MQYQEIILRELSCNLDDITGEVLSWAMEKLLKAGVRDVWIVPVIMKQSRPGQVLNVLYDATLENEILDIIFQETTTLGVRIREIRRVELFRETHTVNTEFGDVRVKIAKDAEGKIVNIKPEFSDCVQLAEEKNIPLKTVIIAAKN